MLSKFIHTFNYVLNYYSRLYRSFELSKKHHFIDINKGFFLVTITSQPKHTILDQESLLSLAAGPRENCAGDEISIWRPEWTYMYM